MKKLDDQFTRRGSERQYRMNWPNNGLSAAAAHGDWLKSVIYVAIPIIFVAITGSFRYNQYLYFATSERLYGAFDC
ncbi:MAG TPA: hypothetical protein VHX86_07385 [Tepidisphaeraceae bacterium]|jgi:hypothetical protein|nr:hypothetical protein [Tepidisphaeraceae bacterium]